MIAYAGMLTGAAATLLVSVWLITVPLTGVALGTLAIAVGLAVALGRLHRGPAAGVASRTPRPRARRGRRVGLAFAAISLPIRNTDADDACYVNRAAATAELNRMLVNDVLATWALWRLARAWARRRPRSHSPACSACRARTCT